MLIYKINLFKFKQQPDINLHVLKIVFSLHKIEHADFQTQYNM